MSGAIRQSRGKGDEGSIFKSLTNLVDPEGFTPQQTWTADLRANQPGAGKQVGESRRSETPCEITGDQGQLTRGEYLSVAISRLGEEERTR